MKTLLVPTDFDLASLNCIPNLMVKYRKEKLNIVLVHMMGVTDNMRELLMLSRRSAEYKHISQEFYNRCAELKREHADRLKNIDIKFFYGNTVVAFRNFLEANEVDGIAMIDNYEYAKLTVNSIDPLLIVSRSGSPVISVSGKPEQVVNAAQAEEIFEEEAV